MSTGQTFQQRWESLDASGRNGFLRENKVRAIVSRDSPPAIKPQEGPLTALGVPRAATIEGPDLYAVVDLGSLGDMVSRASSMAATAS